MKKVVIENVQELLDKREKKVIIKESVKELQLLSLKTVGQTLLCGVLAFIFSVYVTFYGNTVSILKDTVDIYLSVSIELLGIVFGAYAIFQALMRDEIIKELMQDEKHILPNSNKSFINLTVMFIIEIFISVLLKMFLRIIADDFIVFSVLFSNITCFIFLLLYCFISLELILEVINFAINLYRMFNVYNIYRTLDMDDDNDEES